jgi:hypothetical protein
MIEAHLMVRFFFAWVLPLTYCCHERGYTVRNVNPFAMHAFR